MPHIEEKLFLQCIEYVLFYTYEINEKGAALAFTIKINM